MLRQAKLRLWDFFAPTILGIGFIIDVVYIAFFGWWLDPWFQRRENRALLEDIKANLYFLITSPQIDLSKQIKKVRQSSEVKIPWENVLVTVTRWHHETNIRVAPRHVPADSYEIGPLIAALERRHFSENDVVNDLVSAATLLHPRLHAVNSAFSEQQYRQTKEMLWKY